MGTSESPCTVAMLLCRTHLSLMPCSEAGQTRVATIGYRPGSSAIFAIEALKESRKLAAYTEQCTLVITTTNDKLSKHKQTSFGLPRASYLQAPQFGHSVSVELGRNTCRSHLMQPCSSKTSTPAASFSFLSQVW